MVNSTNFSKSSPPSTNFAKPSQSSTNFVKGTVPSINLGIRDFDTDIFLLQTDDDLLLQNGSDNILLGGQGEAPKSTNFTKPTISSTNYGG